MKTRVPAWKVAVATTSLLLIGAFVAYRAGAFSSDTGPATKSRVAPATPVNPNADLDAMKPQTLTKPGERPPSGKASAESQGDKPPAYYNDGKDGATEYFGGSKSLIGIRREPAPVPAPPVAPTPTEPKPDAPRAPGPCE